MNAYIDLETGGLDPSRNQILSIGLVIERDELEEHLIRVAIDPRKPVHPGALRVNGIDPDTWSGYPLDEALRIVRSLLRGERLVAHNASFDRSFMRYACAETGIELPGSWCCTLDWSKRIPDLAGLRSRKLAVLHEHLVGYAPARTHDALEDSRSCMRIAQRLLRLDPDEQHLRVFG